MHKLDLLTLAEKQYLEAKKSCTENCMSYHISWPYLRAANLVGGIDSDKKQYKYFLDKISNKTKKINVLIAGSADTGICEFVSKSLPNLEKITIVDNCITPLNMCTENIEFEDLNIVQRNLLDYEPNEKFDLIICHSLLPFLDDQKRVSLLQKFSELIKNDGNMIISLRLKVQSSDTINIKEWIEKKTEYSLSEIYKKINPKNIEKLYLEDSLKKFYEILSRNNLPYKNINDAQNEFNSLKLDIFEYLDGGYGKGFISNQSNQKKQLTPGIVMCVQKMLNNLKN